LGEEQKGRSVLWELNILSLRRIESDKESGKEMSMQRGKFKAQK
jgi:hypothetical protein